MTLFHHEVSGSEEVAPVQCRYEVMKISVMVNYRFLIVFRLSHRFLIVFRLSRDERQTVEVYYLLT